MERDCIPRLVWVHVQIGFLRDETYCNACEEGERLLCWCSIRCTSPLHLRRVPFAGGASLPRPTTFKAVCGQQCMIGAESFRKNYLGKCSYYTRLSMHEIPWVSNVMQSVSLNPRELI